MRANKTVVENARIALIFDETADCLEIQGGRAQHALAAPIKIAFPLIPLAPVLVELRFH